MSAQRLVNKILDPVRDLRDYLELPAAAKSEQRKDRAGLPERDPGVDLAIERGISWLCRAQDRSTSQDGGVARHFSLKTGWSSSYPETTGYIVPTFLAFARDRYDSEVRLRAMRMLDWLASIQFPEGGFQGGLIDSEPVVPVTFNTGQILLGLAAGATEDGGRYLGPMSKAADWLVATQDPDGCWRSQPTPFAKPGEKAYETHVAWGLFEAARVEPDRGYAEAAMKNIDWALTHRQKNGWFANCCLGDPLRPLTHTLGYVLRGFIEAYRFSQRPDLLQASLETADALLGAMDPKTGFIPGRLDQDWSGSVTWACLTGTVQIAICWMMLYRFTGLEKYRDAAFVANRYVRRSMSVDGPDDVRGGIKGSFPVNGDYGTFEYLNWACKFFVDSNMMEKEIRESESR